MNKTAKIVFNSINTDNPKFVDVTLLTKQEVINFIESLKEKEKDKFYIEIYAPKTLKYHEGILQNDELYFINENMIYLYLGD